MTRFLSSLVLAAALAIAGCGSSSSSDNSTASTPATTAAASTPASPSSNSSEVEVKMSNIQFSPKTVTVNVGQTVKWVNEDSVDHNVTADGGRPFTSDNFGKGSTFTYQATKAGTIKYTCTIHPGMDGTIIVK